MPADMVADWQKNFGKWFARFDRNSRFRFASSIACQLDELTVQVFIESDAVDLSTAFPQS